jgi:hypothetical protein
MLTLKIGESHLNHQVADPLSAIADMLAQYRGTKSRSTLEGAIQEESEIPLPSVLPSSTELFYFYGQILEQCGKYTTGEPMRKLAKVYAKWLKVYSGQSTGSLRDSADINR